jgi:hypothetical protein
MSELSWTSICNGSLVALGNDPIMDIDNAADPVARVCKWRYERIRDAVLRMHPWRCAKEIQKLAMAATAPAAGYLHRFVLPTDPKCIKVRKVTSDGLSLINYEKIGRHIHTDSEIVYLEYTARIEDPTTLDILCAEAISALLAVDLCKKITESSTERERLFKEFLIKMNEAQLADGQEIYEAPIVSDPLLDARRA